MKSKSEILSLMGGIPESVYDSICESFYEESKDRVDKMASAMGTGDLENIARLAHGIKGSAINLHLDMIFEAAKSIEHAAKSGDMNKVQELFPNLKSFLQ